MRVSTVPLAVVILLGLWPSLVVAVEDGRVDEFWVASLGKTNAERTMLATMQGLVNKKRFRLWIKSGGLCQKIYDEVAKDAKVHELKSVWDAYDAFKSDIQGMVVFANKTTSINVATSLCGPLMAVAVEEGLLAQAKTKGIRQLADARQMDQMQAWSEYRDRFARGILVEQDPAKDWHLRDFAVAHDAFVFWKLPAHDAMNLIRQTGPGTTIYGWGVDENESVKRASMGGGDYVASDWSCNLSATEKIRIPVPDRAHPPRPAPAKDGERIVAFVLSDGDNLCFVSGGFVDDQSYYGSSFRGTFSMTWEMAPRMVDLCSMGLRILYRRASAGPAFDDFVMGPSGAGYCFPRHMPDRSPYATVTAAYAKRSHMPLVTVMNDGGDMEQVIPMLEQPDIAGVLYKDWAPYNARKGAMIWHKGKPCVSYRYLLWEGMPGQDPENVAKSIVALPAKPTSDPNSYSLINVHAWSWRKMGGAMAAVKKTVELLPPGTRVVTADEFFSLLKDNIGSRMKDTTARR